MSKIRLSASKISLYNKCSFLYWLKYGESNFPDPGNSGSKRGSVVHAILECLIKEKRRDLVSKLLENQNLYIYPPIIRLIIILARKLNIYNKEDLELIHTFILKALSLDFNCDGADSVVGELKISIESENYDVLGFIDKIAFYKDKIVIFDYKTSKTRKSKEEIDFDYQSYIYTLAIRKLYPDIPIKVIFHFLKFKRTPIQEAPEISDISLKGFEKYLSYIADELSDFTYKKALSNLAKNDIKRRFLCGKCFGDLKADKSDEAFICPAKYPSIFFVLKNENNKVIKSSFFKKELEKDLKDGNYIESRSHPGCPAFKNLWERK